MLPTSFPETPAHGSPMRAQTAPASSHAAGQMLAATSELAKQSETLRTEVDSFLRDIKAA